MGIAFVHLTSSACASENVAALLRSLGRAEPVFALPDEMPHEGPLVDIEGDRTARSAWHRQILGPDAGTLPEDAFDDRDLWRSLVSGDPNVVLWHGLHPAERVLSLRGCWQLRHAPQRVYEVSFPERSSSEQTWKSRPAFFDCASIASRDTLAARLLTCAQVPADEVARRATLWERMRDVPGDWIHHIDGDMLIKHPVTVYDDALIRSCGPDWTAMGRVIAGVLARYPTGVWLLRWRLRVLVDAQALEVRAYDADPEFALQLRIRRG